MLTLVTKKRPSPDAQAAPKLVLTAATAVCAAAERVGHSKALTVGNEKFPPNKMPEILKGLRQRGFIRLKDREH